MIMNGPTGCTTCQAPASGINGLDAMHSLGGDHHIAMIDGYDGHIAGLGATGGANRTAIGLGLAVAIAFFLFHKRW